MRKNFKIIINTVLSLMAMFFNVMMLYNKDYNYNNIFTNNVIIITMMGIFLFIFYKKYNNDKLHWGYHLLSWLLASFMVIGYSFINTNSFDLCFKDIIFFLLSTIKLWGYYLLFKNILIVINKYLNKYRIKDIKTKNKFILFFRERTFLGSLLIILGGWLIYIIAFYPIILSPDPSFQIKQFFNEKTKYVDYVVQLDENVNMTNHHPVVHTLLLGGSIKIGRALGSDNLGLFIYSFIQIMILSSTLAYSIKFMRKNKVPDKILLIILGIYTFVPHFPLYAMSGVKDTIYTSFIILLIIELFDYIKNYKDKKLSISKLLYWLLLIILITLFRNNGLYVVILTMLLIILYNKMNIIRIGFVFGMFILTYMLYNNVILPFYHITPGSIREALSVPFQQTARYVKEHPDDIRSDEYENIDKVLRISDLAERYNEDIADPVKNEYNRYTTSEDLKKYFNTWFNQLLRHPDTYINATLNNTYGYFYPDKTNWYVYFKYDKRILENDLVDYSYNGLSGLRKVLSGFGCSFLYLFGIGLISNIGFNTWILLFIIFSLMIKKKKKYVLALLPMILSLLICFVSPVNTYFRYTMPYIFSMPLVIGMFLEILKESEVR